MKEIVIASKNSGKVREIAQAFSGLPVKIIALSELGDYPEAIENGQSFRENAEIKAEFYGKLTGKACLADDSGLEADALQGAPGIYSARYAGADASDADNNAKLLQALETADAKARTARFRCVLALRDTDGRILTCEGACEGTILTAAQGTGGFGYDPLFLVAGLNKTMAELPVADKNTISHRGIALKEMAKLLAEYLS